MEQEKPKDDFDVDEWDDDGTKDGKATATNEKDDSDLIIGPGGDFVTAPEMSQIFGECLGVWCMTVWQLAGAARPATSHRPASPPTPRSRPAGTSGSRSAAAPRS